MCALLQWHRQILEHFSFELRGAPPKGMGGEGLGSVEAGEGVEIGADGDHRGGVPEGGRAPGAPLTPRDGSGGEREEGGGTVRW